MRHAFGGHPYGPDRFVAEERRAGRVGCFTSAQEIEHADEDH